MPSTELIIEVAPRMVEGWYHACLQGDLKMGAYGRSVEEAVVALFRTHLANYDDLRVIDPSVRMSLRILIAALSDRGIKVEIRFLPTEIR